MTRRAALRIGVLGAAQVTPMALLEPARDEPDVQVLAIAARDVSKARDLASHYDVPRVHDTYHDLLADRDLTAVYIPQPASANGRWTLEALAAGKHVLVEKPMAANAEEAGRVRSAAASCDLVVLQGYHYRYHPFMQRIRQVVAQGSVGRVMHVSARFLAPRPPETNIRWRYELGGGTLMDHGSYAIHFARTLIGRQPSVVSAAAVRQPDVRNDSTMDVQLDFGDGVTGDVFASMLADELDIAAEVTGSAGTLVVRNFIHPTMGNEMRLCRVDGTERREVFQTTTPTFRYQLQAFAAAVERGEPFPTDAADGLANLQVVDAAYEAAGLPSRVPLP